MNVQCPTCGGKLAHYTSAPSGYCVAHSEWYSSTIKCASTLGGECSDSWSGTDFGYVCPTDGTRLAGIQESPIYNTILRNHQGDPSVINALTPENLGPLSSESVEQALRNHQDICPKCNATAGTSLTPPEGMVQGESNPEAFAKPASIQKTAMWYYLKPRWILRRKAQAMVRRKVRSLLAPIAIKSSGVGDSQAYMDAGGCEICGGRLPDGHKTTCSTRLTP